MNNAAALRYAEQRARLQAIAPEWQKKLAYGDNTVGWRGDRYLQLYHNVITDKIEIFVELPDQKPVIVMSVDAETFDIHKACAALRDADHRAQTPDEIIARVDAKNEAAEAARAKEFAARQEEVTEKMWWAIRKETGAHIAPMTVERKLP